MAMEAAVIPAAGYAQANPGLGKITQLTSPGEVRSKQARICLCPQSWTLGVFAIMDLLISYVPYWHRPANSQDGCNWPRCLIKQSIIPSQTFLGQESTPGPIAS